MRRPRQLENLGFTPLTPAGFERAWRRGASAGASELASPGDTHETFLQFQLLL